MQVGDDKSFDDINVTPMVDLYMVLLLIFIIMTTAGVQGMKVDLPKASSDAVKKLDGPKTQVVTVDREGNVVLNQVPVTYAELESKLAEAKAKAGSQEVPVILRGDGATQYQGVMSALDVLGRVGFSQVGLVTEPAK
jgi:biopolymer transport protein ExbD